MTTSHDNRIIGPAHSDLVDCEVTAESHALTTAQRYFLPDGGSVLLGDDMLAFDAQTLCAYARALQAFGLT